MNVWKGEKALAKFGDDGQNGVIDIKTKSGDKKTIQEVEVIGYQTKKDGSGNIGGSGVVFQVTETPAMFPGGVSAWNNYLRRNLSNDFLEINHKLENKVHELNGMKGFETVCYYSEKEFNTYYNVQKYNELKVKYNGNIYPHIYNKIKYYEQ